MKHNTQNSMRRLERLNPSCTAGRRSSISGNPPVLHPRKAHEHGHFPSGVRRQFID